MNRRSFLTAAAGSALAVGVAPAIIRSGVLMPIKKIWTPPAFLTLFGDGVHDDTAALQAGFDGSVPIMRVRPDGLKEHLGAVLIGGTYKLGGTVFVGGPSRPVRSVMGGCFRNVGKGRIDFQGEKQ